MFFCFYPFEYVIIYLETKNKIDSLQRLSNYSTGTGIPAEFYQLPLTQLIYIYFILLLYHQINIFLSIFSNISACEC